VGRESAVNGESRPSSFFLQLRIAQRTSGHSREAHAHPAIVGDETGSRRPGGGNRAPTRHLLRRFGPGVLLFPGSVCEERLRTAIQRGLGRSISNSRTIVSLSLNDARVK